ncbi:MAG: thioesterase family protein, partial [Actinomycetes bacterium]|nr:thioesterase family protein [Actinomycetes bacterium]
MPSSAQELLDLLDLETIDLNLFRGTQPDTLLQRVFGGQVAAQALVAGARTVEPDREVHSLHSYFLLPGDTAVPIVYDVERIRDGRSFSTRRIVARQHGRAIYFMTASFQVPEDGFEHQDVMPEVPSPKESIDLG